MEFLIIILIGLGTGIPIALLINTFIMFNKINKICEATEEINENIETLIKLEIRKEQEQN